MYNHIIYECICLISPLSLSHRNSEIHELPLTLGRLRNCCELKLNGLRIQNVPHHLLSGIYRGGESTKQILAYLGAQLRHLVPYNHMKLMAVGLQGRGKTTLLSVLRNPRSPLPDNVSTVGVVMAEWVVPPLTNARRRQAPSRVSEILYSIYMCLAPRPIPSFSMLHAKRLCVVCMCMCTTTLTNCTTFQFT